MSKEKDKNIDLFKEAAEIASEDLVKDDVSKEEKLAENNKKLAMYISENPGEEFSKLKEAIEGPFAEKFMNIMNTLPDREFMRYYLKSLEYFKPKVTRVEPIGGGLKEDNVINVNVLIKNEKGEMVTMSLNESTNTYEQDL